MNLADTKGGGRAPGPGTLVVSLDFEMLWGVDGVLDPDGPYGANLRGGRGVVPVLLDLFEEFGIHATWAVVGMLMARGRSDLETLLPRIRPRYVNKAIDPYRRLASDSIDRLRFAPDLVASISTRRGQEIGTHTFSHYYCLEPGQDRQAFAADLDAALQVAAREGYRIRSLVFPGNQCRDDYLDVLRDRGILAYRGNRLSWAYRPGRGFANPVRQALRAVDDYSAVPEFSSQAEIVRDGVPLNIRESYFWAPRPRHLGVLDGLRIRHVVAGMARAAAAGGVFHLWWHPHNFGADLDTNVKELRRVFWAFRRLRDRGTIRSLSMGELAEEILGSRPGDLAIPRRGRQGRMNEAATGGRALDDSEQGAGVP